MGAFVREICAICTPIADTGPGNAFTGATLEFVARTSRHRGGANFRRRVTSRESFIHSIATVVITITQPVLQNAALSSRAEELR